MPAFAPAVLIARHVERLRAHPQAQKIDQVLAQAGLTLLGDRITKAGGEVTANDCQAYKQAVRAVYGDAVYAFTKVNFVLGGCTCRDCLPSGG
jgi:hypothetical protein